MLGSLCGIACPDSFSVRSRIEKHEFVRPLRGNAFNSVLSAGVVFNLLLPRKRLTAVFFRLRAGNTSAHRVSTKARLHAGYATVRNTEQPQNGTSTS